jgi:hypothetical protein
MIWKINGPYIYIYLDQWKIDTCDEIFNVFDHKYNII